MTEAPPIAREELLRFVEGDVTAARAEEIRAQLSWCAISRQRLSELEQTIGHLGAPDPALEGVDLVPALRAARSRPGPARGPRWSRPGRWLAGAGALGAAAAAALLWLGPEPPPADDGFQRKGEAVQLDDRWAGIHVWRVTENGQPQPLGARLGAADALLFAYSNLGPHPFDYLLIFGVDPEGTVFWYYPAVPPDAGETMSLPIAHGASRAELLEQIRHDLRPGRYWIYGLFSRQPLRAAEVEAEVEALRQRQAFAGADAAHLSCSQCSQHVLALEVTP